jgi:hypothetical protein
MLRLSCECVLRTLLALTLFVLLGGPARARTDEDKPATLNTIVDAWRARQARAKTFDFVATGTKSVSARTISESEFRLRSALGKAADFSVPDVSFPIKLRLAVDEKGRILFDYYGQTLSVQKKCYLDEHYSDVFVGDVRKTLFAVGNLEFPNAHFRKTAPASRPRYPQGLPVLMVYRGLDRDAGVFDAAKLRLTEDKGVVENRPCLILSHGESMVWVDPARDFTPTRYRVIDQGVVLQSYDIKYTNVTEHGWVPTSWTVTKLDRNGDVEDSVTATVAEYRISLPISEDVFDLRLPPGTWVNDYLNGETYILREGGVRRPIVPGEYDGYNYKRLLVENPPAQKRLLVLIGVNVGILFLIIVFVVLYRRGLRRSLATSG